MSTHNILDEAIPMRTHNIAYLYKKENHPKLMSAAMGFYC